MASELPSASAPGSEFNAFCDFVVQIRNQRTDDITPEQSVQEFREHQSQLQQWQAKNELSAQQANSGMAQPLDDEAVLGRLRTRLIQEGMTK